MIVSLHTPIPPSHIALSAASAIASASHALLRRINVLAVITYSASKLNSRAFRMVHVAAACPWPSGSVSCALTTWQSSLSHKHCMLHGVTV
jgi:hypothetical protein